jgi:hypothetical protein
MEKLNEKVETLFETARMLAWRVGELKGSGSTVPHSLEKHYNKISDNLWSQVEYNYGKCTCDISRDCPSYDVHSQLFFTLDETEEHGYEFAQDQLK